MQLGDNNYITAVANITTIGDFRRLDMAYGGQGAPLVPAFHQALLAHPTERRVVLHRLYCQPLLTVARHTGAWFRCRSGQYVDRFLGLATLFTTLRQGRCVGDAGACLFAVATADAG